MKRTNVVLYEKLIRDCIKVTELKTSYSLCGLMKDCD